MQILCPKKKYCATWSVDFKFGCKHYFPMDRCKHGVCLTLDRAIASPKDLPAAMLARG